MLEFDELISRAVADTKPYRWIVQQSTCRACGNIHEREIGLMREHAPGAWLRVVEPAEQAAHKNAPVEFRPAILAWCEACHSRAAQELTARLHEALDMYGNTTALENAITRALEHYRVTRQKEHFHHAAK